MKKLLLIVILAFLTLNINAQTFEFTYLDSTKLTKSECFIVCKTWVINNFKTNAALQMEDKDAGIIIVKGNLSTWIQNGFNKCEYVVEFKIDIQIKDFKVKMLLNDFNNTISGCGTKYPTGGSLNDEKPDCGNFNLPKKMWLSIKSQAETNAKETMESIKTDIKNGKSQDNW